MQQCLIYCRVDVEFRIFFPKTFENSKYVGALNQIICVLIRILESKISFCFANISDPNNRTEIVLYSKFVYGSQFS